MFKSSHSRGSLRPTWILNSSSPSVLVTLTKILRSRFLFSPPGTFRQIYSSISPDSIGHFLGGTTLFFSNLLLIFHSVCTACLIIVFFFLFKDHYFNVFSVAFSPILDCRDFDVTLSLLFSWSLFFFTFVTIESQPREFFLLSMKSMSEGRIDYLRKLLLALAWGYGYVIYKWCLV